MFYSMVGVVVVDVNTRGYSTTIVPLDQQVEVFLEL